VFGDQFLHGGSPLILIPFTNVEISALDRRRDVLYELPDYVQDQVTFRDSPMEISEAAARKMLRGYAQSHADYPDPKLAAAIARIASVL